MRSARLSGFLLAILTAALLVAPQAAADPPFHLPSYITDRANALNDVSHIQVDTAINNLYNNRQIRLWVVYVNDFSGQRPESWAQSTYQISDLGDYDALLAVATTERAYSLQVPKTIKNISSSDVDKLRRDKIEPALHRGDWAGAAVAAAKGLDTTSSTSTSKVPWATVAVVIGIIVLALVALLLVMRWRRHRRRIAEFAAARRVDPTDANALASLSVDALDDLSKSMVVEVDNAVRTSDNELALAVEEFGNDKTQPFTQAVNNAKATLAQAFTIRQQLDDAVPETPAQRRDLLMRVVVSAATADRELDAQTEAFHQLRDLVINAPARLDTLTQQLVDLTARIAPSQQKLAALHDEFDSAALASVAGNVTSAQERLTFADQNITRARELAQRPVAGESAQLVDSVRAAESALGQGRTLLDAVDSAESDIKHAAGMLPSTIADIQKGIAQADALLQSGKPAHADELAAARAAAAKAVDTANATGSSDPLGAFTQLTKADAELDRILAEVAEEQQAAERLARTYDQALFTAQSRVRAVSDYVDTRRGSIGAEARTRLAEATRQLEAAQTSRPTDLNKAIAYANGASMLAAQAQSLANTDVQNAQRVYARQYRGGGGSNMGAVIGGIVIGNILSGALRGGFGGGWGGGFGGGFGGGWSPTSFGGSSGGGDGGGFMGGGGRF
ncbi:MAG TPA: TPM domain-containing protein [Mycobacterium sp.]|nr:TPM domain-containing protein [Mycobacterium sp.]